MLPAFNSKVSYLSEGLREELVEQYILCMCFYPFLIEGRYYQVRGESIILFLMNSYVREFSQNVLNKKWLQKLTTS